jgi:hypothetical protein
MSTTLNIINFVPTDDDGKLAVHGGFTWHDINSRQHKHWSVSVHIVILSTWCGCEISGMILLCDLKEAMQLDHGKDVCACFSLHQS